MSLRKYNEETVWTGHTDCVATQSLARNGIISSSILTDLCMYIVIQKNEYDFYILFTGFPIHRTA